MPDRPDPATAQRDSPDPREELVKVFDAEHESEALVVKGLLDSMGIDADITSLEAVQAVYPGVGGTIILVRAEDAEKARQIIEESQAASVEDADDTTSG